MKLWGRISSINVQKVAWCLDEIGLSYERVDAGGAFGIVDTPDYRRLNPNGLVPTLVYADGFALWESNATLRHLASTHPEAGLWPADPRARAEADRWMDWQATNAAPAIRDVFLQLIRTPPEKRDDEAIARSTAASERAAAILDEHLATWDYVAGATFTVADIAVGLHAHRWLNLPLGGRLDRPHLQGWYARLAERPAPQPIFALPIT